MTSRQRKEQFIKSFGESKVRDEIGIIFRREGLSILDDEIIDEIAASLIAGNKLTRKTNRQNRALHLVQGARISA
ncbi:hypothetical protein [Phyllobacterium ifriqiyense]|uniref:hypothetical protein n=1 Tax=Phyllobacterium ifriqiyense TaxID=314238 RepID=UPI00339AB3DA